MSGIYKVYGYLCLDRELLVGSINKIFRGYVYAYSTISVTGSRLMKTCHKNGNAKVALECGFDRNLQLR